MENSNHSIWSTFHLRRNSLLTSAIRWVDHAERPVLADLGLWGGFGRPPAIECPRSTLSCHSRRAPRGSVHSAERSFTYIPRGTVDRPEKRATELDEMSKCEQTVSLRDRCLDSPDAGSPRVDRATRPSGGIRIYCKNAGSSQAKIRSGREIPCLDSI
jgi:hypothetical protein